MKQEQFRKFLTIAKKHKSYIFFGPESHSNHRTPSDLSNEKKRVAIKWRWEVKYFLRTRTFHVISGILCALKRWKGKRFEAIWRDWPSRILFSSACCIESISSSFIISSILQGSRRFLKTWPGHNSTTKDGSLFFFTNGTSCCLVQGELLFRRSLQAVRKKDILWVKYRNKMHFVWKNIKR